MAHKDEKEKIDNDAWITSHFKWLIDNFPGQYIVISEGEPFIGYDAAKLEQLAKKKHPRAITLGMPIPRPEDFSSVL